MKSLPRNGDEVICISTDEIDNSAWPLNKPQFTVGKKYTVSSYIRDDNGQDFYYLNFITGDMVDWFEKCFDEVIIGASSFYSGDWLTAKQTMDNKTCPKCGAAAVEVYMVFSSYMQCPNCKEDIEFLRKQVQNNTPSNTVDDNLKNDYGIFCQGDAVITTVSKLRGYVETKINVDSYGRTRESFYNTLPDHLKSIGKPEDLILVHIDKNRYSWKYKQRLRKLNA